jgi:hypothetical protein
MSFQPSLKAKRFPSFLARKAVDRHKPRAVNIASSPKQAGRSSEDGASYPSGSYRLVRSASERFKDCNPAGFAGRGLEDFTDLRTRS